MEEKLDIITLGESLIELSSDKSLSFAECLHKYYGGDTLTTAIAALRMGAKVGYITRVGNDYFKEFLLDSWQAEGLDISQVRLTDEFNGLYLVSRTKEGKKEFAYYRKKTAATKLSLEDIDENYIKNSKILYATGITQSLSLSAKEAVKRAFEIARENNVMTVYDPNYNPLLTTPENSKEAFEEVIELSDVVLMSAKNDVKKLFDIESFDKIIKNLWDTGAKIVVLKTSDEGGYYTGYNGDIVFCPFYTKLEDIVDTTCSGDAFNGGFLYALSVGYTPFEATQFASIVSGLQIKELGAIKSIPQREQVYEIFDHIKGA